MRNIVDVSMLEMQSFELAKGFAKTILPFHATIGNDDDNELDIFIFKKAINLNVGNIYMFTQSLIYLFVLVLKLFISQNLDCGHFLHKCA